MRIPPEWMPCLTVAGVLALEITMIAGVAAALQHRVRSSTGQRAIWQAAILATMGILILEISGVSRAFAGWLRRELPPQISAHLEPSAKEVAEPAVLSQEFRRHVAERLAANVKAGGIQTRVPPPMPTAPTFDAGVQLLDEPYVPTRSLPWPELVWLIGTAAFIGLAGLGRVAFLLLFRSDRRPVKDKALMERMDHLARRVGICRPVRVFESSRLEAPVAFGLVRPAIGLPEQFTARFSETQQDVMLAHELAHVAARDPAWQAAGDLAAALLWWHPAVWWARHRLRVSAEMVADEASIVVRDGPAILAECLVELAAVVARRHPLGPVGATGPGFRSGLGKRIERLFTLKGQTWPPLNPVRSKLLKLGVPLCLTIAAILCTAWVTPKSNQGVMQTLNQKWKRSVATLALFTTWGAQLEPASAAGSAAPNASSQQVSGRHNSAQLSAQVDGGQGSQGRQLPNPVQLTQAVPQETQLNPFAKHPQQVAQATAVEQEEQPEQQPNIYRMDPRLLERYGLKPVAGSMPASVPTAKLSRGKQQVDSKLNQIIVSEVHYDALPLNEIIRDLQDIARRGDPSKQGLNFVISNVPEGQAAVGVDPTTGVPLQASPSDVGSAIIKLSLRDVRLKDVLDAMMRVADQPIKYSVEDYGVLISPGVGPTFAANFGGRSEGSRLQVRTFRVDTNTFLAGLENAFGITTSTTPESWNLAERAAQIKATQAEEAFKRAEQLHKEQTISEQELKKAKAEHELAKVELEWARTRQNKPGFSLSARNTHEALSKLLQQLGVNMEVAGKGVFYNEIVGVVMVRGTEEDLEVVQAAIETLGGKALRQNTNPNVNTTQEGKHVLF